MTSAAYSRGKLAPGNDVSLGVDRERPRDKRRR